MGGWASNRKIEETDNPNHPHPPTYLDDDAESPSKHNCGGQHEGLELGVALLPLFVGWVGGWVGGWFE